MKALAGTASRAEYGAPPAPRHPTAELPDSAGSLARVMALYIVFVVGRIEDIVPGLSALPVVKIVTALAIFAALVNRGRLAPTSVWSWGPSRLTLAIMILSTASILFSVLKSGTLQTILGSVLATSVGVVLMIRAARNWRAVRLLLLGCVFSATVLAFSAEATRLLGRAGYTRDMDPNDFALVLVSLLPVVLAFAVVSRGLKRLCFAAVSMWAFVEILLTQSRGGFLGLLSAVAVLVVLLPSARMGRPTPGPRITSIGARIIILTLGCAFLWHAIPDDARDRFESITSWQSDYNLNLKDPTSRLAIWTQTLPLALRRPWGWGAGTFQTVDGKFGGGRYMAPHNMYLQVLVELGIVGLVLFLAAIASAFRYLMRESFARPPPEHSDALERRTFARALVASFAGLCVSGFFLSALYDQVLWMMMTLAALVGSSGQKPSDALGN